jgi:hypothetical protein
MSKSSVTSVRRTSELVHGDGQSATLNSMNTLATVRRRLAEPQP